MKKRRTYEQGSREETKEVLSINRNYILEEIIDEENEQSITEACPISLLPPLSEVKPTQLIPKRRTKEGESAAGISVLAIEG